MSICFLIVLRKYGRKILPEELKCFVCLKMYPGVANLLLMCWFYIVFFKNIYMFVFRFTNPSKKDYLKIRLFCHVSSYFISLYSGLIVKDRIIWFYSMPVSVSLELFQKTVLLLHVCVTIFISIGCFNNIRTLCKLVDCRLDLFTFHWIPKTEKYDKWLK